MHEDGVFLGQLHQRGVDLKGLEKIVALGGIVVAHRNPGIRHDAIRARDSLLRIVAQHHILAVLQPGAQFRIGGQFLGAGDIELEAELDRRMRPAGEHIVAVAAPADRSACDGAFMFLIGQNIRHHLAGMGPFGQAVDHRDGGIERQFLDHLMVQQADHDGINIARDHPRRVGHGFLARQLHLIAGQHQGGAAQLPRRHVERDAGAGGLLVKDHRQHLAVQRPVRIGHALGQAAPARFALLGVVNQGAQGGAVMIGNIEKMPGLVAYGSVHWAAAFCDSSAVAAWCMNSMPSRTSDSERVRGGNSRTTLSPAGSTTRPA